MPTQRDAVDQFIEAINATGGITKLEGFYAPVADPDWTDLAEVYLVACTEKHVFPVLANGTDWDPDADEED
jgi:hypothetical protein